MAEHGGKAPPKKGGEKKSGGGFWGFLGNVLSNVAVDINVGKPGRAGAPSRNPTDPAERMEPVHEERKEAYEETIYRKTEGADGTAPAVRVDRDRHAISRSLDARMGSAADAKVPQGGGAPLSRDVRAKMEPRLGGDLSGVRVHTSGESAAAAQDLSAKAFTVGSDVHFGSGNYQPGTKEGDKLLAHELTHVVQGQRSGVQRKADDGGGDGHEAGDSDVSHPDEPAEKEADHVADRVAEGLHGGEEPGGGDAAGKDGAPAGGKKAAQGQQAKVDAKGAPAKAGGGKPAGADGKSPDAKAGDAHGADGKTSDADAHGADAKKKGDAKAADGNAGKVADAASVSQSAPPVARKKKDDAIPITQTFVGLGRKIHRLPSAPRPAAPRPPAAPAGPRPPGAPAAAPRPPGAPGGGQPEAPRPPTALTLSPISVEAASPAFADALATLPPSGKLPAVERGGGTPAQVADQIVKSHPNARMDPGGNLTLPPIDGGAVGQAASPDAAANVIAQQTGVPTVSVLPKEDGVDFEVQINPLTRAGTVRAKSPSERAEFKTALGKLDSTAKSTVKAILDERKIRYTRAANWADARAKLETEPAIKAILDKPFNQGNAFGDAAHGEGIKQLNKALAASGSKPLKEVDAGTKISHWKPQVNDEVSPFEGINPALRNQFWDSSTKAQAGQAMYSAFDQRLKLGEDEEHDWYRPQNRKEAGIAGGGMRITYTNSKGADFAVTVDAGGMVESITGTHLTLKEPGSRGATGTAGRAVPNAGIESSHLIADRFRGSGYKSGANLIATSAHYNDPIMLGAENQIGNFIKNMKASEFEMTVGVKWMDVDTSAAVAKLQQEYPDIVKPKLKAQLQQELTAFVARLKTETPNLKRVKQTKYTVKVKDASGAETPMDPAPELGMDMWLGMKSAPTG